MNHKDRVLRVKDIDRLKPSTATPLSDHQELIIVDLLRKWSFGLLNNHFRFFPIHAMLGDVVSVPVRACEVFQLRGS